MKSRWSGLVWTASVAVMTATLAAGCGDASEQAETPEPETVMVTVEKTVEKTVQSAAPTPAPAQPPSAAAGGTTAPASAGITCEVDQACDLDGSTVTVTSVQETQTIDTSRGDAFEGDFVIVEFDYTHGGDAPEEAGRLPFRLSDSDGNVYSLDFEATSAYGRDNDRGLIRTTVRPDVRTPGAAVFEVAPEAEGFTLLVADPISPERRKTAKIPLPEASRWTRLPPP